jgi:hypothetical protein
VAQVVASIASSPNPVSEGREQEEGWREGGGVRRALYFSRAPIPYSQRCIVYVCVCVCLSVWVWVCMDTYLYMYLYMYRYTCIYTCTDNVYT